MMNYTQAHSLAMRELEAADTDRPLIVATEGLQDADGFLFALLPADGSDPLGLAHALVDKETGQVKMYPYIELAARARSMEPVGPDTPEPEPEPEPLEFI